ncbi:hypothetical protein QBC39DRAFT_375533 [Podospora conica]|nr:hypothetical protein QBC39DRAFT_375533 [Schizothecium conicum]
MAVRAFSSFKSRAISTVANLQADLEFKVDYLADSVHKLDQRNVPEDQSTWFWVGNGLHLSGHSAEPGTKS